MENIVTDLSLDVEVLNEIAPEIFGFVFNPDLLFIKIFEANPDGIVKVEAILKKSFEGEDNDFMMQKRTYRFEEKQISQLFDFGFFKTTVKKEYLQGFLQQGFKIKIKEHE